MPSRLVAVCRRRSSRLPFCNATVATQTPTAFCAPLAVRRIGEESALPVPLTGQVPAGVAELVDAPDSKSGFFTEVWVRVPPSVFAAPGLPERASGLA